MPEYSCQSRIKTPLDFHDTDKHTSSKERVADAQTEGSYSVGDRIWLVDEKRQLFGAKGL